MNPFVAIGILMISGLLFARVVRGLKLPAVTGYLVAGLLIGPSLLGVLPVHEVEFLMPVETLALGFIAFSIGREFRIENLRRVGKGVVVITIVQGIMAALFVALGLEFIAHSVPVALILGGIATATAPAATLLVVREYHASGPFTDTLMQVVALDDAIGIIVFGVLVNVARASLTGTAVFGRSLLEPLWEITASLGIGALLGVIIAVASLRLDKRANASIWSIGAVLLGTGLAEVLNLSPLLLNMTFGAVYVNLSSTGEQIAEQVDHVMSWIYVPFFVLAGASLRLESIARLGMLGASYLALRSLGKVIGAWLGAKWAKAPDTVTKYLGIALLPQAGVSIGMVALVRRSLPEIADTVAAVILGSVMVYELIGPLLARIAIVRSGEAHEAQRA